MKSSSASKLVKAYDSIHQELTVKGFKPKLQTLDNEASTALKNFFTVNNIAYQLVPPRCHRRNTAERAIRTFKEHFVAGLSSVDPSFPMHLWDRLMRQAEITFNLLRTYRLHPQLSAAVHYHGLVDYNKTAFAPPGCKITAHEKPGKRRAWAPHVQHGYSLGPAMHHYRCQNVYISTTASKRIVDTLEFFPHNYQLPQLSSTDWLLMTSKEMTDAFQMYHRNVPLASVGDDTKKGPRGSSSNYQTQNTASPVPRDPSFACHTRSTPKPHSLINPNLRLTHAQQAANEIKDGSSQSRHPRFSITTKGGQPSGTTSFTSEGAHWILATLTSQPVSR
jgi:hypothetical protein